MRIIRKVLILSLVGALVLASCARRQGARTGRESESELQTRSSVGQGTSAADAAVTELMGDSALGDSAGALCASGAVEQTALAMAALVGDVISVEKAVEGRWNLSERNACGVTPLMMALAPYISEPGTPSKQIKTRAKNKLAIARLLLSNGADVTAADVGGLTAVHRAANSFESDEVAEELVSKLLSAGATPNAATDHGITPLMVAVERRRVGVVQRLLAAGADSSMISSSGETALAIARKLGATELLPLLEPR